MLSLRSKRGRTALLAVLSAAPTLRTARPQTPIVLVEDRTSANAFLLAPKQQRNETSRAALKAAFRRLANSGTRNPRYLEGENPLGSDGEGTVDSSHPNDSGFASSN